MNRMENEDEMWIFLSSLVHIEQSNPKNKRYKNIRI
ncbi:hypothetical protein K3495_g1613 [Podosphaera aphanis]|nr:hypothetical protein K3495_g1613 [Podosphaera aphanis]